MNEGIRQIQMHSINKRSWRHQIGVGDRKNESSIIGFLIRPFPVIFSNSVQIDQYIVKYINKFVQNFTIHNLLSDFAENNVIFLTPVSLI
jgi:peptidyl-tRNA hydrolase